MSAASSSEHPRILFVVEDPSQQRVLRSLFEGSDFWFPDVLWSRDHGEAVARLRAGGIDIALVDDTVGGRSGLDFLREPGVIASGVPVILLGSGSSREADLRATGAGAADYLVKNGLTGSALERSVRYAVEAQRRHRGEARFRALIENSRELLTVLGPDGSIQYVSPSVLDLLGFDAEERKGAKAILEVHPDDRPQVDQAFVRLLENPTWLAQLRYRVRHRDGSWRMLDTTAQNLLDQPHVGGIVVHSRDITERVQHEERIRVQAELLDAVGQAVIATDLDGMVTYWNQAAERLYGWRRAEALGRPILELTPVSGGLERADEILEALRAGKTFTGEVEIQRRDGSTIMAEVTDSPIRDEHGQVAGIIGISTDVSARKRLENELRQAQKMEAVGRLAGGIAHDFNNLLTAIRGHTTFLAEVVPAGSRAAKDVGRIEEAVQRAADLTRQLLAFSRRQMLEERVLDLRRVVEDIEPMLRRLVPERIAVGLALGEEPRLVRADVSQLHHVLLNLVVNSVDAITDEGRIDVAVGAATLSREQAGAFPWKIEPGAYASLAVRDTGHGMPHEVQRQIFEPFFTTKPEGRGTGLGLSTVFGIVKQSQGHVVVDSTPGQGSSFTVLLPVAEGEAARDADGPVGRGAAPGTERVLVVEDEPAVRRVVRRILERADYGVVEAANGLEALERLEQGGPFDLVVSDLVMPEMGGLELARRLRDRPGRARMLVMSGYSEEEHAQGVRDLGVWFLKKPFTADRLLDAVRRALDEDPPPGDG
jgi:PAS domain S-box-containing protein